ncbi:uncharacterized protein LOC142893693 isoform X2 [Nelusetta ayraudi]|uniref:uncharacterized protein LOC142893693 isoform X2 n=1 Tax=Nelusetta ayraudi TaxID=303726 RepID=UPI003F6FE2F0
MEFACGFVYVPPPVNPNHETSIFKRSALLPPSNRWVRPRDPPPPPPTAQSAGSRSPKFPKSPSNMIDLQEEGKDVKTVSKLISLYQNSDFFSKLPAGSFIDTSLQQTSTRKTALLPPHMKPAANSQAPPSSTAGNQTVTYDNLNSQPDFGELPWEPYYSQKIPEGAGVPAKLPADSSNESAQTAAPPLPPRPSFMRSVPDYLVLLPSSTSPGPSPEKSALDPSAPALPSPGGAADKGILLGNPNVVLVSLGKLISEERAQATHGEPTLCSQCGSVLDSLYDNVVNQCYFCTASGSANGSAYVSASGSTNWPASGSASSSAILPSAPPQSPARTQEDLFFLSTSEQTQSATDALLLFCIDISGSMSITSQVLAGDQVIHRSRLEFVQEAVLQCVQTLSVQCPDIRVGLITFNHEVTMYGGDDFTSNRLSSAQLADSTFLVEAAAAFPSPPALSQTRDFLKRQVMGLTAVGTTALGPAALLAIAKASRQPGSKVIICTDGKANTDLGNLEVEDNDARTLLSSTIFYQDLGEYAANQGVTVSVLSIEGTDCRLDELGRLADRTGGKVVIANPSMLHSEFEHIIENRTIATHCSVSLLLPSSLHVKGERESGHVGTREVGNVAPDKEITFQFGASDQNTEETSWTLIPIKSYQQRAGGLMPEHLVSCAPTINPDFDCCHFWLAGEI